MFLWCLTICFMHEMRWCEMMWDIVRLFFPIFSRRFRRETKAGSKEYRFRKAEEGRLLHLGEDGEPLDCPYPLKEGEKKYIYPQGGEVTIEVTWKITPLISWLFCYCDAVLAACLKRCAEPTMPIHVFVLQTHDVSLVSMVTISFRAPISSISSHDIPLLILEGGDTFQCSPVWWILGIRISIWQVKTSEEPHEEDPWHTQSCWAMFCHGAPRSSRDLLRVSKCIERIPFWDIFGCFWRSENLVKGW